MEPIAPGKIQEVESPVVTTIIDKQKILDDNTIKVAWIPKALNNLFCELGKVRAEIKAAKVTAAGPYTNDDLTC